MSKDKKSEKEELEVVESGSVKSFFKRIENDIVKWFIGTIFTLIGVSIPFYFNTTSSIQAHNSQIENIQTEVSGVIQTVDKLEKSPSFNGNEIKEILKKVDEIQARQQKLEVRQDKMYDIMLEIAGKK